jgi:serine/threonine protein kinase
MDPAAAAERRSREAVRPPPVGPALRPLAELAARCLVPDPASREPDGVRLLSHLEGLGDRPASAPTHAPPAPAAAPPDSAPALEDLLPGWRVVRLLGRGGMGEVHEMRHPRSGERVAVKRILATAGLTAEAMARFTREARILGSFNSHRIVRILDAGERRGHPFLVMEYLEGETLAARLARGRSWGRHHRSTRPRCRREPSVRLGRR